MHTEPHGPKGLGRRLGSGAAVAAGFLVASWGAPVAASRAQGVPTLASGVGIEYAPPVAGEPGPFAVIAPGTPLPPGSRVRTGAGGGAAWRWADGSEVTLHAGSEATFYGDRRAAGDFGGARAGRGGSFNQEGLGFIPSDSAVKAILTHHDAALVPPPDAANPAAAAVVVEVALRRGALTARLAGETELRVRFVGGAVVTRGSHFTLTTGRDDHARLTVERGNVAVLTPGGRQVDPTAGTIRGGAAHGRRLDRDGPPAGHGGPRRDG